MKLTLNRAVAATATAGATLFNYAVAFAQGGNVGGTWTGPQGSLQGQTAEQVAIMIIKYILGVAGLVAVVYLIIGGFQYITSGGNEESNKKAVRTILNAIIGMVVILAAYAIVLTVQRYVLGYTSNTVIQ